MYTFMKDCFYINTKKKKKNDNKMILDKIVCYLDRRMNVEIAEISEQQKQFEVFFVTNNTNLGIF